MAAAAVRCRCAAPAWSVAAPAGAPIVCAMDAISAGLVTLANGALSAFAAAASPVTVAVALCALSLAWLAAIRLEELDRQGTKPTVARH